jgi:hypothetical protein
MFFTDIRKHGTPGMLHVKDLERQVTGIAKLERQGQTTRPCRSLASVKLNNLR